MSDDLCEARFTPDPGEPLGFSLRLQPSSGAPRGVRVHDFEYSSRGDRVPGRLWLPEEGAKPFPLVLLEHGAAACVDAPFLESAVVPWVRAGAAVASVDLPLHGERASAKLSTLLRDSLPESKNPDALGETLLVDFTRQAVVDLRRSLDALAALSEVSSERVAFAGFGLGAIPGAIFCAFDRRPRAAALALAGGCFGPAAADPISFIDRCRVPLLFVGTNEDEGGSRAATRALFEAAPDPKDLQWFDGTHSSLPGSALEAIWNFLQRHLYLGFE